MNRLRNPVRPAAAFMALGLGCCVLTGWAFHVQPLKSLLPGLTTMKANTAISLVFASLSVLLQQARTRVLRHIGLAAALAAVLIGLLTLVEYCFGVRLGLDELLFADPDTTSPPYNGRMSPATAVSFVAAGLSLTLLGRARGHPYILAAHFLAIIPAACGFVSLAGYAYGVESLHRFGPFVSVALHTAIGLLLLSLAIVLTRRDEGWSRRFAASPIALAALLRIGGVSLVISFLAGLLVIQGERAGFYDPDFSETFFAMIAASTLIGLAFYSASILAQAEDEVRVAREETVRRREEVAETRGLHLALIEGLPQLVWTCLADGNCNYLSPQWVKYTGVPEADHLGFNWFNAIDPRDAARTQEHWLGAVAGRHPYDTEYRIVGADGISRWFKTRGIPLRNAQGQVGSWFGTCTDIEEIVAARELLAQSREKLEQQVAARTSELMEAEEKLRQSQKMEAVGQLTGGIAHDFNNILTGIMGSLERIQVRIGQGQYAAVERYVSMARADAERAAALTHRLLAFSRRQTLDPRPTDVNTLIAGLKDLIQRTVGPSVALEVAAAAELWTVLVDPPQLESALLNLVINARDAMPNGGRVVIKTDNLWIEGAEAVERDLQPGPYVSICLADSGCGMPPEIVARAFDPFFTTKPIGLGTGLGLSMVYGFVRQSGGQAKIESAPDRGTSIVLYLPRSLVAAESRAPAPILTHQERRRAANVLLVDDEPNIRTIIAEVLREIGYALLEAENGPSALRTLRTVERIDLLITDIGLPGAMNGLELAKAARVERPGLPVLFITGYEGGAVLAPNSLTSNTQVLTKPFSMQALATRIDELLGSSSAPAPCDRQPARPQMA